MKAILKWKGLANSSNSNINGNSSSSNSSLLKRASSEVMAREGPLLPSPETKEEELNEEKAKVVRDSEERAMDLVHHQKRDLQHLHQHSDPSCKRKATTRKADETGSATASAARYKEEKEEEEGGGGSPTSSSAPESKRSRVDDQKEEPVGGLGAGRSEPDVKIRGE